jgi:hypothetical protein
MADPWFSSICSFPALARELKLCHDSDSTTNAVNRERGQAGDALILQIASRIAAKAGIATESHQHHRWFTTTRANMIFHISRSHMPFLLPQKLSLEIRFSCLYMSLYISLYLLYILFDEKSSFEIK